MILIVGGTGTLGLAVAKRLVAAELPTTILSRNPDRHSHRFPAAINFVQGDLRDKDSLRKAVSGKSHVVAAAHSIFGRGREASQYVDDVGGKSLIDVSVGEDIERFIYVSAWFSHCMAQIPFFAIKRRVELHLQASGLAHTILRPTAFMDMHAEQMIGLRIAANKMVIVFGPGTGLRNFVSADDVAKLIVKEIQDSRSMSRTVTIGGPGNHSTQDVIAIYEALLKRAARIVRVPLVVAAFSHWFFTLFHPGLSQVMAISCRIEGHGDGYIVEDNPQCAANVSLRKWVQDRMHDSGY